MEFHLNIINRKYPTDEKKAKKEFHKQDFVNIQN